MRRRHEIVLYADWVELFGQKVSRPERVSIAQWLTFWEKIIMDEERAAA